MRRIAHALVLLGATWLSAQDLSRLPNWAAEAAREAQSEPLPPDAEAWVLLDRTEIAYTGDGEIRQRRFRVVRVLSEQGLNQRVFVLHGLGGKASKVKKLKGWNLRPDGEITRIDSDHVVTLNDASDAEFSTDTVTGAALDRVVKGSYIAFESLEEIQSPIGPVSAVSPMESVPVRRWELDVAKREGWFSNLKAVDIKTEALHFTPWVGAVEPLGPTGMRLRNLGALPKGEGGHPFLENVLPLVRVRFLDPAWAPSRIWQSWDDLARWTWPMYQAQIPPQPPQGLGGAPGAEGLRALWAWMGRSLTYKQVYLTPERGWVPEPPGETSRKRYGDCKDLSAFLIAEARRMGYPSHPALARIVNGSIERGEMPYPVFNHVISAIQLDASLGWPAEVQTPKGRFLLVDPTDAFTPLGFLGSAHQDRQVMICLPGGAEWVDIPSAAILGDAMDIQVRGEAKGRSLAATLTFSETGHYWGLRSLFHHRGLKGLQDHLQSVRFDLPAHAGLEVLKVGDPLALHRPFEVVVQVSHPEGFRWTGQEWVLPAWGLPGLPEVIQKAGVPRRYPIAKSALGHLSFHAEYLLPVRAVPLLASKQGRTPFRDLTWRAEARPAETGCTVILDMTQSLTPARFDLPDQNKGLSAWKQDRGLMKILLEDGLAFHAPK